MINKYFRDVNSLTKMILYKIKYKDKLILNSYTSKILRDSVLEINGENASITLDHIFLETNVCLNANRGGRLYIGNKAYFGQNSIVVCKSQINIGENVSIAPNVCIYDHDHKFDIYGYKSDEFNLGKVYIGDNTWIGAGCIILKNTIIGANCVIAAGTILSGETIPDNCIVKGNRKIEVNEIVKR